MSDFDDAISADPNIYSFYPMNEPPPAPGDPLPDIIDVRDGRNLTATNVTLGAASLTADGETSIDTGANGQLDNAGFVFPGGGTELTIEWVGQTAKTGDFALIVSNAGANWFGVNALTMSIYAGAGIVYSDPVGANTAKHHFAIKVTGGNAYFFCDGVACGSGPATTPFGTGLTVGALTGAFNWQGRVSKLAFFSAPLDDAVIASHAALAFEEAKTSYPVTNPNFSYSPGNWRILDAFAETIDSGANVTFGVEGSTAVRVNIDTLHFAPGAPSAQMPIVYHCDGASFFIDMPITHGQTHIDFNVPSHALVEFGAKIFDAYLARWDGSQRLKITSIGIDVGATLFPFNPYGDVALLVFSDSTGEGAWVEAPVLSTSYPLGSNARKSLWFGVARALGMRLGLFAKGFQNWNGTVAPVDMPSLENTFDKWYDNFSKLANGKFPFAVGAVAIEMGANGAAPIPVQTMLPALRAALPTKTPIVIFKATDRGGINEVTAGYNAYIQASGDKFCFLKDAGPIPFQYTRDGIHQNEAGEVFETGTHTAVMTDVLYGSLIAADIKAELDNIYGKVSALTGSGTIVSIVPTDGETLTARTEVAWDQRFTRLGWDSSLWTQFVFTLKTDADTQSDDQSLLMVKISNPPDPATDGIVVWREKTLDVSDPMRSAASLSVVATGGDTQVSLSVKASAMDLPPSAADIPYVYEIDRWDGTDKRLMQSGTISLSRNVLRTITAP